MKYYFIRQESSETLDLIFAGWGMDHNVFINEEVDNDLCICYDYSDLYFEEEKFSSYRFIRLTAWSMGVWAASVALKKSDLPFIHKIAINGTHIPVDDKFGIPEQIFKGTLNTLSPASLDKFNRRMCGSYDQKLVFESVAPQRSFESLKTELQAIYELSSMNKNPFFKWNYAVIGKRDLIFPVNNQKEAWKESIFFEVEDAHFPSVFLKYHLL